MYLQGLEDQLLSVIVKYERPELEQRRETLIQETRSVAFNGCSAMFTKQSIEHKMAFGFRRTFRWS